MSQSPVSENQENQEIQTDDLTEIEEWRMKKFTEMNFGPQEAKRLAKLRTVDTHLVQRMISQGATHEQVIRIVT